jgi:DNA (cytosine-5)-methyltransferase 1
MIKVGSDFSGVGAFNQALMRLGIEYKEVFACDMDKYARQTFIHNYGEPEYYPTNVYKREIPTESLDIYMTSPPCQAFSLAGKRLGKDDQRGILFFNSYEFIQKNKPRYFIFENVKGLLSDDSGRTFQEWVNMLGGKSVNGLPVLFPNEESVPYHLYWQVLNAKHHGVPQNRERVFLIGIRDDAENRFQFPKEEHLTKRLKDVLENNVNDKYFLSEKMLSYLETRSDNFNSGKINYRTENDYATTLTKSSGSIDVSDNIIIVGNTHPSGNGMNGNVFDSNGISRTLSTNKGEGIKIKSATSKKYKIRRLTPRECFRLMDFPDTFTWNVSDSQAYKQAGNSIAVNVLYKILKNMNL